MFQRSTDKEPKVHGSEYLMFGYVGYGMGKKDRAINLWEQGMHRHGVNMLLGWIDGWDGSME